MVTKLEFHCSEFTSLWLCLPNESLSSPKKFGLSLGCFHFFGKALETKQAHCYSVSDFSDKFNFAFFLFLATKRKIFHSENSIVIPKILIRSSISVIYTVKEANLIKKMDTCVRNSLSVCLFLRPPSNNNRGRRKKDPKSFSSHTHFALFLLSPWTKEKKVFSRLLKTTKT